MRNFAVTLACLFVFSGLASATDVQVAPQVAVSAAQSERDARFRSLCASLAQRVKTYNARIEAESLAGEKLGSAGHDFVPSQSQLESLASKQQPAEVDAVTLAVDLIHIAERAPSLYQSILADVGLRTALVSMEAEFGVPFFATKESNKAAVDLVDDLAELAARGLVPDETPAAPGDSTLAEFKRPNELATRAELDDKLSATRAKLMEADQTPLPKYYTARRLREAVMFVLPRLTASGRAESTSLMERLMQYMNDHGQLFAYDLLRQFATAEQPDHALTTRLGELYISQHCASPAAARFTCLNVLTFLSMHYHDLHQEDNVKTTQFRLAQMLDGNAKLQLLMQSSERDPDKVSGQLMQVLGELEDVVPPLDSVFDGSLQQIWTRLHEWQATSYWVTKTAHGQRSRLLSLVPPKRGFMGMDEETTAAVLLGGGFSTALELGDTRTALEAVDIFRVLSEEMIKEHSQMEAANVVKLHSMADVMELGVLAVTKRWKHLETLAQRIQSNVAPQRSTDWQPVDIVPCMPGIMVPGSFEAENQQSYFEDLFFAAFQLEADAAIHFKKQLPSPRIRKLFEHDVLELFRVPSNRSSTRMFRTEHDEERQDPLSPAQFLANWPRFSKLLEHRAGERKSLAHVATCLLIRPELKPALVTAFVNADVETRAQLSDALNQLLDDSGLANSRSKPLADGEFQLLQIGAMLQADNGISAATARAVFTDEKTREKVRRAEGRWSQLGDRLVTFQGFASIFRSTQFGDMSELLDVATADPKAYERYEELKQQGTVTLKELNGVLRAGEAAVLFMPAEKRLLAVVIRPEGATLFRIDIPRSQLQTGTDQLLASLRFTTQGGRTLPAPFRADRAWALYRTVVRPLEKELAGLTTVYLIGGAELSRIPFQALVTAPPPSQSHLTFASYRSMKWLGDRYAFVSVPSVHALKFMERHQSQEMGKLLGIGEPSVAVKTLKELRLDGMPETGRLLQRTNRSDDHVPLLGRQASIAGLADASQAGKLAASDILLINSHTLPAGAGEHYGTREAAIVLAPSSGKSDSTFDLLDSSRVMELNFAVRVVMLLACETAGGRSTEDPQPYAGLVNAFFYAGADTVLATNQPVDESTTADLAVSFLKGIRDDRLSSAAALQKAVANIRCTDSAVSCTVSERSVRAHPGYWSQFILVGSGR
ncbi:CHAT domain-containing protein [Duganella vulcania]|uniref:CHAT domain-containing protein n=1 Tax=Duganella vulcania TaxID=2692166 RepID=A0A845GGZ9_9BURK|nr:CHAT domain-containing protein [Duganella vulcania]MYM92790.1 CHAT domain-containing protein [Duganella vulcania]